MLKAYGKITLLAIARVITSLYVALFLDDFFLSNQIVMFIGGVLQVDPSSIWVFVNFTIPENIDILFWWLIGFWMFWAVISAFVKNYNQFFRYGLAAPWFILLVVQWPWLRLFFLGDTGRWGVYALIGVRLLSALAVCVAALKNIRSIQNGSASATTGNPTKDTPATFPEEKSEARKPKENPPTEPISTEYTVGRNDPCICGSGLKFKFCHGRGL